MKWQFVCATRLNKTDFFEKYKFLEYDISVSAVTPQVQIFYENTKGLPEIYNQFLTNEYKDTCVIFKHDDLLLEDAGLFRKVSTALKQYNIVGLAGTKSATIKSPALWHLMADSKEDWSGAVGHAIPNTNKVYMSSFGPTPERCLLLDGLFLAVDVNKALEVDLKFDEQFKFHFYDLDFCLSANQKGLKMGTCPVWTIHSGLGDSFKSTEWQENEKKFIKKWSK